MDADNPLNNQNTESTLPDPSGMGLKSNGPKKGAPKNAIIIGAVAAVVFVLILVVVIVAIGKNSSNSAQLKAQYDAGYQKGSSEQKTKSESEYLQAQAKDTRTFKAASEFGSFEIPIPKSWSFAYTPKPNDGTFEAVSDPDSIDLEKDNHVFLVELKRADYDKVKADYDAQAKKLGSDIKASDIKVSTIDGRQYTGTFDTKSKVKSTIVVLPYREKILVFRTDDPAKYGASFSTILSGVKLQP